MTIRKTLLLAFLLVGLIPAALMALLAFERTRQALQADIERGLAAQADAAASEVHKLVYERLQNAATWSRLEVMQDLQVGDVDKRLSAFLQRLATGYGGLYRELAAVDTAQRVVASSDAARIGRTAPAGELWQVARLGDSAIALDLPRPDPGGPPAPGGDAAALTIRAPIASAFGAGALGELQLRVDWTQIDHLLDQAGAGSRMVALLDAQGRLAAGSRDVLATWPRHSLALAGWAGGEAGSRTLPAPAPLPAQPMLAGIGRAAGFAGFQGFGWQVVVLVPRSEVLAPVRSMALIFAALLGGVALLTVVAAGWVSQAVARPIVALTEFSRHYRLDRRERPLPPPAPRHSGEVAELREAFVQMISDIDESQQTLARTSALAAVGEMSAVIAHEIRTPLGIVLSSAQVLQREPSLSDEGRELAGFIESETTRLSRLVSSMLDSARPRPPQIAPTNLDALVRHGVALLAAQAAKQGVRFTTQLQAGPEPVPCDAEQITQVLLNLILNGLQILAHGGTIEVATRREDGHVLIDIADDGPGIAPQARSRIFEAFFFQREGGVGLGLAVVQRIVAAHGGNIEAGESALGGALFRVRLPGRTIEPT